MHSQDHQGFLYLHHKLQPRYPWRFLGSRFVPKAIFTSRSPRRASGSLSVPMDVAGGRATLLAIGVLIAMAIGRGPMPAGIGSVMSRGPGPPIIMAAGITPTNTGGIGCRRHNGRRRGFPGTKVAAMSDGRRCSLPSVFP